MEQIGFSLVDAQGGEIQFWGDQIGVSVGVPDVIQLPNGDRVHGAKSGDEFQGFRLVPRMAAHGNAPGISYTGAAVEVVKAWPDLALEKEKWLRAVDADAEAARARYITPGAGMAMTYQEKHAQARAVDGLGETAANSLTEAERDEQFPTLSASVGIEGATLWDCAQLVIQKYEQFADLSRVIERTRLQGKKSISDASDVASVRAAYEAITWTV